MRFAARVLLPGTGWIAFTQLMDLVGLMMDLLGNRCLPRGSLALIDFHTIRAVYDATISFITVIVVNPPKRKLAMMHLCALECFSLFFLSKTNKKPWMGKHNFSPLFAGCSEYSSISNTGTPLIFSMAKLVGNSLHIPIHSCGPVLPAGCCTF